MANTGPAQIGYSIKAQTKDAAEILLYDVIGAGWLGGISAQQFATDLKALGPVRTIDLRINSDGGDVFEGRTMYTLLSEHSANIVVHVDGLAASIASLIAMAGDEIRMADGAMMMIHRAWGLTIGNEADHARQVELLKTIDATMVRTYAARTKQDPAQVQKMMCEETWMTGEECVALGFADGLAEPMRMAAKVRDLVAVADGRVIPALERFRNVPAALRPRRAAALRETAELRHGLRRSAA